MAQKILAIGWVLVLLAIGGAVLGMVAPFLVPDWWYGFTVFFGAWSILIGVVAGGLSDHKPRLDI